MVEQECTFCKIVQKKIPVKPIYEDENTLVILDLDWAIKGHTLVIWKLHHINASDLIETEFKHFSEICRRTEKALLEILNKDRAVIIKTGGLVPHFHFHIYPVSSETSWLEIKDIFDKKVKYNPVEGEETKLIEMLKEKIESF